MTIRNSLGALCLTALLLGSTAVAYAAGRGEGVRFEDADLQRALLQAHSAGRPLFVELYATWCPACRDLDRSMRDERVGAFLNPRFVAVRYDVDRDEGHTVAQEYGVEGVPTMLMLDGRGNLVGKLVGTARPADLVEYLRRLWEGIPERVRSGGATEP